MLSSTLLYRATAASSGHWEPIEKKSKHKETCLNHEIRLSSFPAALSGASCSLKRKDRRNATTSLRMLSLKLVHLGRLGVARRRTSSEAIPPKRSVTLLEGHGASWVHAKKFDAYWCYRISFPRTKKGMPRSVGRGLAPNLNVCAP